MCPQDAGNFEFNRFFIKCEVTVALQPQKFTIYVSYKYWPTIFSYNKVFSTLPLNKDGDSLACECKDIFSKCVYEHNSCLIPDKSEVCKHTNVLFDTFVILPLDKARNNFGIARQKFYRDVIRNEFGVCNDRNIIGNNVYRPVDEEADAIYTFHEQKLLSTFGMKLLGINQYIPLLYLIFKQYKCPYKFQFFAGVSNCQNRQLAIELPLILKSIKHHFENYHKVIQKRM